MVCIALCACQLQSTKPIQVAMAQADIDLALQFIKQGDLPWAYKKLIHAQQLAPSTPSLALGWGAYWCTKGELKRGLAITPANFDDKWLTKTFANCALQANQPAKALMYLSKLDNKQGALLRAKSYYQLKAYVKALGTIQQYWHNHPKDYRSLSLAEKVATLLRNDNLAATYRLQKLSLPTN